MEEKILLQAILEKLGHLEVQVKLFHEGQEEIRQGQLEMGERLVALEKVQYDARERICALEKEIGILSLEVAKGSEKTDKLQMRLTDESNRILNHIARNNEAVGAAVVEVVGRMDMNE